MALKWGIVSAGRICHDFVTAVQTYPETDHKIVAIGARSLDSAQKFATEHNIPKAYGGYEGLAKDKNVGKSLDYCESYFFNILLLRHCVSWKPKPTTLRGV